VLEDRGVERDVAGLAGIVEFLAQARGDLLGDLGRVDGRLHAAVDRQDEAQLGQIGFDGRLHIGILELDREGLAIVGGGAVDLAQRRGGGGLALETGIAGLPVRAQLGRHAPAHEGPAHRRGLGLELGELRGIGCGQRVGDGGEQLGHLHQRALEGAQRLAEQARFRRQVPVAAARHHAPGRDPGGRGADAGAYPRIAVHAAGEAVALPAVVGGLIVHAVRGSPAR
jgi:hypothetical protein